MMSAQSPAISAPKKVPADRMETMRDWSEPFSALAPGPSTSAMKTGEPMTPLMYPES